MCRTACTEPQCLYNGALYLYLYLYSPYVPYGLYKTSVPVQRCTLTLPIPLLPRCAVRPVQNLSAFSTVNFTFAYTSTHPMCRTACTEPQCLYNGALYLYLYLYSPDVPYGLYRTSVPVHRCTLPLPITLLPLCAVRPVQSLSAFTTVHFTFTYSSAPPMCRTACTEPQCLYNGELYLYLYLYSPDMPYGLYRTSVPFQRCTLFFYFLYLVPEYELAVACRRRAANNPFRRNILRVCRRKILKSSLKNSETSIWGFGMTVFGLTRIFLLITSCGVVCCYVRIWVGIATTAAPRSFPTYCQTVCCVYQVHVVFPSDFQAGY